MIRRLLLLSLIPLLVISHQLPAEAITKYGPSKKTTVRFDTSGYKPFEEITCALDVHYAIPAPDTTRIDGAAHCAGEWDSGIDNWDDSCTGGFGCAESSVVRIRFDGSAGTGGSPCSAGDETDQEPSADQLAWNISAASGATGLCVITTVCMSAEFVFNNAGDLNYPETCQAFSMGTPPAASTSTAHTGTCPKGMPVTSSHIGLTGVGAYAGYHGHRMPTGFAGTPTVDKTNTGWSFRAATATTAVHTHHVGENLNGEAGWVGNDYSGSYYGAANLHSGATASEGVVGVQLYHRNYGPGPTVQNGLTDPAQCVFWFGPKIIDRPADTKDEPYAPLGSSPETEEPPPTPAPDDPTVESGCDFKLSDPASWLSGGMCAAVGLLGAVLGVLGELLDAVLGLVGDLIGALGGLLETLFIPDVSSWGIDELIDQLNARPPFSLIQPLYEETAGFIGSLSSSGDCGVLADFGETEVSCSQIKNAPGMSTLYGLVQVALVTLTGLSLFRMVGGLFQDGQ